MEHLKITGGLAQMCRLCLSYSVTMTEVFWFSSELGKEVADIIMECAPVQITRHDKMPTCICQLCFTQLKKFHQFQMQAVQSDRTLQRYLQQSSVCNPQIEVESALEEQSNNFESQNYNADVAIKLEPFEISDEFDNVSSKQEAFVNFSSENKINEEISLKSEIKDEPMDDNLLIPAECVDTVKTRSIYDSSEISCEDSMIEVGDTKVGYFECPIKDENDMTKKIPLLKEETYIPLKNDDSSLCSENIKDVDGCRSNENNLNRIEHPSKLTHVNEKFHSVLVKQSATSTGKKSYQCDVCQKCFTSKSQLKIHGLIHTGEKPFKCDICQMCFRRADFLRSHILKHTGEKPYQCDICQMSFRRTDCLKTHKLKHTGEKLYQCDICHKGLTSSGNLKKHILIHTGDKRYQCHICKKCFRSAGELKRHNLIHSGEKPYKCDVCQMCFRQAIHLKSHKLIHTGEKPYQCDICKMRFRQLGILQNHNLIHTGEKPYQCDICQMSFRESGSLKKHNLIHTGEKPYQCDICQMCFRQSNHLKSHKLIHAM